MKNIKDLSVTVTYKVGLGDIKVSDKIFNQLKEIADNKIELDGMDLNYPEVCDWLRYYINERDCHDINYEINELS